MSPHTGLYKGYEWGLWSASIFLLVATLSPSQSRTDPSTLPFASRAGYCTTQGDLGAKRSYCYTRSIHPTFQPAQVLLQDVDTQYSDLLRQVLPDNVFTADACASRVSLRSEEEPR